MGSSSHRQEPTMPEGVEHTWLLRHGAEPGTTTVLQDALTSTE
ncbi:MAG: hypothetical protein Q4C90_00200 [Kocuria sp.]|nr:hypothetical protein [Kocuria sp.]MDO4255592.1 hypothetical protein [Kocuria sp.]